MRQHYADWVQAVAKLLSYDAILKADQQDINGAMRSCQAILNAGRALGDEPTLLSQLTRRMAHQLTIRRIERTLAHGEPSTAALADLQRLLAQEVNEPLLLIAGRGERAGLDDLLHNAQQGKVKIGTYFDPGSGRRIAIYKLLESLLSGSLTRQRASAVQLLARWVEAAKLPPEKRSIQFKALDKALPHQSCLVRPLMGSLFQIEQRFRVDEAELRCTLVMVAVERFRRRKGRWPESLNELVPEFLARLPTDPCNGLPLCYRRLKDGVVIYSVGADGVDNGGNISRRGATTAGVDWGVRLWDVPARRRPPAIRNSNPER